METGLAKKTVVVTGGGSNIGRAISLAFAGEGANVVITDLDEAQGKKVADQANALGKGGVSKVVKLDVTKITEVESVFKKIAEESGGIHVLVNVVGGDVLTMFKDTTPEIWDKLILLNYRTFLNSVKSVLPYMISQKGGSIVSIASDAGRVGEAKEAVYSGTKGAVIAASKSIAKEVGRYGIRLNMVCPGMTIPKSDEVGEGSAWKGQEGLFSPEVLESIKKLYPLRRIGTGDDTAKAVVFLASDAADFITGQTLSVSGGFTMV
ncbi:MAG: SDR family NAD(P)-dependent oxidoreductase [Desulfobulbaceae bacterium]|nr:SDR family NAD(P)-dependent oxidoreductase [Desulfobulbaceae bacterium]